MTTKRAVVFAPGEFGTWFGKTGNILVMYERNFKTVAVIDETKAGQDAGEVLGIGKRNIPIVKSLEDSLKYQPEALIIGISPPGGFLTKEWKFTLMKAIDNGLDLLSTMHDFLSNDRDITNLAEKKGVNIFDARKPPPPEKRNIFEGKIVDVKIPRIAILATDAAVGKNVTCYELIKESEKRGLNAGFVSTGQTTMIVGADVGIAIDAVTADYMPGFVEAMCIEVAEKGKDIIFVEGQSSISHPAYAQDCLPILYGCWPQAIVLCHDPFRKFSITHDKSPYAKLFKIPSPRLEKTMLETIFSFRSPQSKVVAVAVNGYRRTDEEVREACDKIEKESGLPTTDPFRFGAGKILNAIIEHLASLGIKVKSNNI